MTCWRNQTGARDQTRVPLFKWYMLHQVIDLSIPYISFKAGHRTADRMCLLIKLMSKYHSSSCAQHVFDVGGENWSTWRKPIQAREECANSTQKGLFQPWTFLLRGDSATSCMPPYTLYTCTGPTGILTTSSENKHDIFLNCGDVCVETGKLQIIFY